MKKTFVRLLAVAMCVVMTLTAAPLGGFVGLDLPGLFDFKAEAASYSGECGDNLTWSLDTSSGVLNITGTGAMTDWSFYSSVPWCSYSDYINIVNIADGVTTIGENAFCVCGSLASVTIPDSVTTIGDGAFYGCYNLTSIIIPDGVTSIGEWAFYECSDLTSVILGDSVTTIGYGAFYWCTGLKNITISDSVTSISSNAFWECSSLTNITIPSNVTEIGIAAFFGCYSLTSITVDANNKNYSSDSDGVLFNKDKTKLVQYPIGSTRTSYTIPDSVTIIGYGAFAECSSLATITIPDSVTTIEQKAFLSCYDLRHITIPDSVITIGDWAFDMCDLTDVYYGSTEEDWNKITIASYNEPLNSATIHFTEPEPTIASGECGENLTWVFDAGTGVLTISGTGKMYDWEGNPSTYENSAPWSGYSSDIRSVVIEDGVTSVGEFSFFNCVNVTNVSIADTVESIGSYSFAFCEILTSVTIPDSVTTIGDCAFAYCESLTSVTIPDSVTTIGTGAFVYCDNLTNITVDENNKNYSSNSDGVLFNKDKTTLIQYPTGKTRTSYVIPDSVTTIGDYAFSYCSRLTSVTIPDGVTSISYGAFGVCSGLESVIISDSVTSIGDMAFYECRRLTDIYYASTEEEWNRISIGSDNEPLNSANIHFNETEGPTIASGECGDNLTWVLDGNGLLEITGTGAMANWDLSSPPWYSYSDYIKTVDIADGVTTVGDYAFSWCELLTRVKIPDSVTSIGEAAFGACDNLTNITVDENNKNYSSNSDGVLFNKDKTTLIQYPTGKTRTSYVIPDSVTTIGDYAFSYCSRLTSVTIPDGVTSISYGAFGVCSGLESVIISDSVTSIDEAAFYECSSLTDVYYGGTKEEWNKITVGSDNESLISANIHYIDGKPSVSPVNGAVVDDESGTIYGLAAGVESLDSFTELADGYEWSYDEGQYGFGTGTVATLKNGDEVVAEYTVIIFGDIDGDGWYDANDAFIVNMIASGLISADRLSAAQFRAADCNHDGVVDSADFYLLNQASLMLDDIDQSATKEQLATNAIYIGYCSLIDQTAGEETNLVPAPDNNEAPSDTTADVEPSESAEAIFIRIIDFFKKIIAFIFGTVGVSVSL